MATIDRRDRRYILSLNDQAASFRKLAEVTVPPVRDIYLVGLGKWLAYLDNAIDAAERRAA